jgi:hypothetical protein
VNDDRAAKRIDAAPGGQRAHAIGGCSRVAGLRSHRHAQGMDGLAVLVQQVLKDDPFSAHCSSFAAGAVAWSNFFGSTVRGCACSASGWSAAVLSPMAFVNDFERVSSITRFGAARGGRHDPHR